MRKGERLISSGHVNIKGGEDGTRGRRDQGLKTPPISKKGKKNGRRDARRKKRRP